MGTRRRRLDAELVRRGLVGDLDGARALIDAGRVTVDGGPATKPSSQVAPDQAVAVARPAARFVSRGGEKLDHALAAFGVEVEGRSCLDAGISTGGFTDCLLQRGAAHVTGVDVGYGQVAERVRTDPRVEVRERTNVRDLTPDDLPTPPALIVCDVSFISLASVLPTLHALGRGEAELVALVKPQFEAARHEVGEGGVVRDPGVWRRVLVEVVTAGAAVGWACRGVVASPLTGPAGNVEFLVHLVPTDAPGHPDDVGAAIDAAVAQGRTRAEQEGT